MGLTTQAQFPVTEARVKKRAAMASGTERFAEPKGA